MAKTALQKSFPKYPFWDNAQDIYKHFAKTKKGWSLKGTTIKVWVEEDQPLPYAIGYSGTPLSRTWEEHTAMRYAIQLAIDGELMSEDSFS